MQAMSREERRDKAMAKQRIIVDIMKSLGNPGTAPHQVLHELQMKQIKASLPWVQKNMRALYNAGVLDRELITHGQYNRHYFYYLKRDGERKPVLPEHGEVVVPKNEVVEPVLPEVVVDNNQELNYTLDRNRKFTITKAGAVIELDRDEATEIAKFLCSLLLN